MSLIKIKPAPEVQPTKQELLASITVTTQSGKTFDGNETARKLAVPR